MPLSKRDTKFFLRLCILLLSALTLGLAVRVVFSTSEIEKLFAQSLLRDVLLFAAPITSLAVLHYSLAVKSFGIRHTWVELVAFTSFAMIFAAIVAPAVIGKAIEVPPADCPWYRKCVNEIIWVPDLPIAFTLATIGATLLLVVAWSQFRSKSIRPTVADSA